jgi:hypothetical protein
MRDARDSSATKPTRGAAKVKLIFRRLAFERDHEHPRENLSSQTVPRVDGARHVITLPARKRPM